MLLKAFELVQAELPRRPEVLSRIGLSIARDQFHLGEVGRAFATCERVRYWSQHLDDADVSLSIVATEVWMLVALGRVNEAMVRSRESLAALERVAPLRSCSAAPILAGTVGEAALALADVELASSLASICADSQAERGVVMPVETLLARVDIARGHPRKAQHRVTRLMALPNLPYHVRANLDGLAIESSLWIGQVHDAVNHIKPLLNDLALAGDRSICFRLLGLALRACADLRQAGIAVADTRSTRYAEAMADEVAKASETLNPVEATMHSASVVIDAEDAEWHAELARLRQTRDSDWWEEAAGLWNEHSWPHRCCYAKFRVSEAMLKEGRRARAEENLVAAFDLSWQHVPLRRMIIAFGAASQISLPATDVRPNELSGRELEVMRYVSQGFTAQAIGRRLNISPRTVQKHQENAYRKVGCSDRLLAVQRLAERGVFESGRSQWMSNGLQDA
jgi:DNA-binding CsgD family transcriptional regulator